MEWRLHNMRKILHVGSAVAPLVVALLILPRLGRELHAREGSTYKSLDLMCDIMSIIERDYIEKVSSDKLIRDAVQGMLSSLDSYSHLIPAAEPAATQPPSAQAKGLETYGLEVAFKDRLLTVVAPVEYGPAWKSGIKSGDIILKIGEEATEERPLFEFVHKLRAGTFKELVLQLARRGEKDFIDVKVAPGKIEGPAARSAMLDEKVGMLRITRFDKSTVPQVRECLKKLEDEKAHGLVIDLRDCPGGQIAAAIEAAELFLPAGQLITTLQGRAEGNGKEFRAQGKPLFTRGPCVVLINGGTSGAAEVFGGALQGGAKGILMGQASFGCAFEESSFPMRDGSVLVMITGVYQTPDGDEIQDDGLIVDVEVPLPPILDEEAEEERAAEKEKTAEKDKKEKQPDPMLQRAVDLVKGIRIVGREERSRP